MFIETTLQGRCGKCKKPILAPKHIKKYNPYTLIFTCNCRYEDSPPRHEKAGADKAERSEQQ